MRREPIDPKTARKFESYIGWNQTWWNYYIQYKEGVDELVKSVENNKPIDTVSLPLLFMLRHSLELGLKANILKLELLNENIAKLKLDGKSHRLDHLFNKLKEHLNPHMHNLSATVKSETTDYLITLSELVDILHKLDVGSYEFRYPIDTLKMPNFEWSDRVLVGDIVNLYYRIQTFLLYLENVLVEEGVMEIPMPEF